MRRRARQSGDAVQPKRGCPWRDGGRCTPSAAAVKAIEDEHKLPHRVMLNSSKSETRAAKVEAE